MKNNNTTKKIAPCRSQDIRSETSFRASLPSENRSEMEGVALVARRPSPSWYRKSAQRIPRNMPATQKLPMRRKFGILVHFVGERLGSDKKKIRTKKDSGTDPLANAVGRSFRASCKSDRGNGAFFSAEPCSVVAPCQPDDLPEKRGTSSDRRSGFRSITSPGEGPSIPTVKSCRGSSPSGFSDRRKMIDEIVKRARFYSSQIKKGRA